MDIYPMGLNYTDGCVNFRDVGGYLNLILGQDLFQENKLFRGGSIDHVKVWADLGKVQSVINLRNGPDPEYFDCNYYHFPMANKVEKYHTAQREVKRWLNQIVALFETTDFRYPILVHCLSGKDRTGIVIAALLRIMDVDEKVIIEEYLLSEGEVTEARIGLALDGLQNLNSYFDRVNLERVRHHLDTMLRT